MDVAYAFNMHTVYGMASPVTMTHVSRSRDVQVRVVFATIHLIHLRNFACFLSWACWIWMIWHSKQEYLHWEDGHAHVILCTWAAHPCCRKGIPSSGLRDWPGLPNRKHNVGRLQVLCRKARRFSGCLLWVIALLLRLPTAYSPSKCSVSHLLNKLKEMRTLTLNVYMLTYYHWLNMNV